MDCINDKVTVVIPTFNGGKIFTNCLEKLFSQSVSNLRVIVVDSSSDDETVKIAEEYGCEVHSISRSDFGHGKTRSYALSLVDTEYVVFMTQDAVLKSTDDFFHLLNFMEQNQEVAAAYGRQVAGDTVGPLGSFARIYNYPSQSFVNTLADKNKKGIKAAFLSDSFAIYRTEALRHIGGFPEHINFGEDMYVSAKLLMAGYKTGYCADAIVYHAHDFSLVEEFRRYSEVGKFHKQESWLLQEFGKPEGEGFKFIKNEFRYLIDNGQFIYLPISVLHNLVKFVGYKWGLMR